MLNHQPVIMIWHKTPDRNFNSEFPGVVMKDRIQTAKIDITGQYVSLSGSMVIDMVESVLGENSFSSWHGVLLFSGYEHGQEGPKIPFCWKKSKLEGI